MMRIDAELKNKLDIWCKKLCDHGYQYAESNEFWYKMIKNHYELYIECDRYYDDTDLWIVFTDLFPKKKVSFRISSIYKACTGEFPTELNTAEEIHRYIDFVYDNIEKIETYDFCVDRSDKAFKTFNYEKVVADFLRSQRLNETSNHD